MSERIIISKYGYGKTAKFYEDLIKETIEEKDKEIERLHSIIKEVREYIYLHSTNRKFFRDMGDKILNNEIIFKGNIRELLEIINKVG